MSRYWQMILKASSEIKNFSKPLSALEMAIIRMSYISDLPTPDEIIKKIEEDNLSLTEKKTPNSEITQPSKQSFNYICKTNSARKNRRRN